LSYHHIISSKSLPHADLEKIMTAGSQLTLSAESKQKIQHSREYLDQKIAKSTEPIYGINTGFGSLYNKNIPKDQLEKLQENLVLSHACGMGAQIPNELVRLILFLKIQSLAYGYSGVQTETVERLIAMFNENVLPNIYEMGSLGASGDLAPLAHLSLPLIGLGEVYFQNKKATSREVLQIGRGARLPYRPRQSRRRSRSRTPRA